MRFLVTGGAGFIGSHIVERLLKDGHFVRVLDNFSSGTEENLSFVLNPEGRRMKDVGRGTSYVLTSKANEHPTSFVTSSFELLRGDIRDASTCDKACANIDYVLHQAALRSVPKSMTRPHEYNAVNIDGTVNILEASLKAKVKRVVLASSSSIYGEAAKFPERETDAPLLISPYALTKLAGEYYSRVFSENYGLETVNLRYFNVFGPRQAVDDEYSVVIPKFITCILRGEQPPIHGTGKQSRDFTYIDNVVEANILAATAIFQSLRMDDPLSPQSGKHSQLLPLPFGERVGVRGCEVFNVACGSDNTILQLVDTLNKILGTSIKPAFTPTRPGDVMRTLADISKIKSALGYEPKVGFKEGLRKTVEWFEKMQPPRHCERTSSSRTARKAKQSHS